MKFSFNVKVKSDTKVWDKMRRNLLRGNTRAVNIGWWHSRHPTGVPVAQVASYNEEGHYTGRNAYSPPRPFLRINFMGKIKSGEWVKQYYSDIDKIAKGVLSWRDFNRRLSKELKETLQKEILEWNKPMNSPYTVAIKGFNDPLIHTGTMYDSIKTKIVRRGF